VTRDEAQLYALVHDGTPGDVDFYVRFCGEGKRVLELGSGTGRVARALAKSGFEVTGLESDPGMLAEARATPCSGLTLVEGDMRNFAFDAPFDRILIPFTGLYCLPDAGALDACLSAARAHLAPGGLLAFDVYPADEFHAESQPDDFPEDQLDHVKDIVHEGKTLSVFERSSWEPEAARIEATYVYRAADGSTRAELTISHRYVLSKALWAALERAGLSLLGLFGSFDGAPFDSESEVMIVVAELAEDPAAP